MHFKIHSILVSISLFFVFTLNAQNGLNFQGVARNTNNIILASQPITLRLSIIRTSVNGATDYTEIRKVNTNAQGLFSVVIGDTGTISSLGNFASIDWKLGPKFLKIEMDVTAGNNFVLIGTTQFQSVAYAQFAQSVDAEKLNGIVPVEKGGTGTSSLAAFKTALSIDKNTVGLSNVNNTSDTAKPISNATKLQLDTKVSTETFSSTIDLLAPIASPTFTGNVRGITKAMVGLNNIDNTSDTAKPISNATKLVLDTKVSAETFSNTLLTKENAANKSTATNLGAAAASDILFPTQKAVKTYVDAQSNAGGVADGGITTIKLADAAVTDAKIGTGISKAKVGLENVDNTADADKPISTAVADALNLKASTNVANVFTERQTINGTLGIIIPNTDNHYWYFDEDEQLIFPNSTKIEAGTATETIIRNSLNTDFSILTNDGTNNHQFKFTKDGFLVFENNAAIGMLPNDNNLYISSFQNIVLGDPNPMGNSFKFDIDNSALKFPFGSNIYSDGEWFGIQASKDGIFEITTIDGRDPDDEEDDIFNSWEFNKYGILEFPNGTEIGSVGIPMSDFSIFKLKSSNGFFIVSGEADSESNKGAGVLISPYDEQGKVKILTREYDEVEESEISQNWTFDSKGKLTFPDGTTLAGNYSGTLNFELNISEYAGFKISTNPTQIQTWEFDWEGTLLFPDGSRASANFPNRNFGIETIDKGFSILTNDPTLNTNSEWNFGLNGILSIPGAITLSGTSSETAINISPNGEGWSYLQLPNNTTSSTANVRLHNDAGNIELATGNFGDNTTPLVNRWYYNKNGSLSFPDGTITAGNISNTGNFGFDTSPTNSGFSIITAGTSTGTTQLWSYNTDGSLAFPNGAIISGTISGTNNFGIDTRITENGFSIITSGDTDGISNLWEYATDGVLNLPGGASIGMVDNLPFYFTVALQISTPNVFLLKSTNTGNYWRFEANGNTVFPADFEANNIHAGIVNVENEFKIGGENIYDKFKSEVFSLSGGSLTMYNNNITTLFQLNSTPRANSPFTMYLNGMPVNKKTYTINGNIVTYTKSQTETELVVQFDYIKY